MESSGGVLIDGAKACGKMKSAKQLANSILEVDRDEQVSALMNIDPKRLLHGATPRLIDEWQEEPKLWDYIRHEIDERKKNKSVYSHGFVKSCRIYTNAFRGR